ncbi:LysR substrate-binding domain-containing protein [Aliarcobacter butzleri]|jgi:DNA-binding transcriptional LysR family regulator|uniref:LysR family transcriptional regulator n=1 Tax=Aliarcobacter butzleri L355 TaxID=1447263 RepID=A0A0G9KTP2_9BACT|nr:LysR substrate-binding domain-containing protein [Aliarcobacter butzleri]KLE09944.1 LysR family transcriptional regulator [Aliarcobacter butzleri L355]MCG3687175.1 LysR substrate-binding domain-containing protein [Aliarcobacter butzleri]MCG3707835.1 LysR substrate-binding domain-containing protein [Aliarcobacter butzleri]MCT7635070.1 LysR substrate-binding domain-containing protein [Aliarcobacter butzleri]MDK2063901.1 LysR substrate-binding domain-containing protein [Aliarcobacter butzleri]
MTLKELNFFYKLCENPQVTQVASELNISQSAISLAIKSLETSLNEQLFDRIGKKLILNEKGKYFKEKTLPSYLALIDASTIFQENKLAGNIKIAASKTISNYIMPNIYYDFLSKYKDVKLDILTINSSNIIDKILKSELDIGLIEVDTQNSSLIKEKLADDELIVVSSDEKYPQIAFIDAIKKRWILREIGSGTREIFMNKIGEIAKELDIFMQLQDFEEIKTIVLNNKNTVTSLSKVIVQKELDEKKLFQIKLKNLELKREFYLVYHKEKSKNLLFETFVEFIKSRFN